MDNAMRTIKPTQSTQTRGDQIWEATAGQGEKRTTDRRAATSAFHPRRIHPTSTLSPPSSAASSPSPKPPPLRGSPRGDGGESAKGRAKGRRNDAEKSSGQKAGLDDNSNEAASEENDSDLQVFKSKKKKQKKANVDDVEFHKRDEVKFGEVVQAPPKLVVPKAFKKSLDASHERLRLKAVEAYRGRKKWSSWPGVHLPFASTPSTPS
ncbi:hypothetical protein AKJ16_DCAP00623 [Drosera capensis]